MPNAKERGFLSMPQKPTEINKKLPTNFSNNKTL